MPKPLRRVAAVLAVVVLAACGSGPGSTAKRFAEAMDAKEFTKAKELMTPQAAGMLDLAVTLGASKLRDKQAEGPFEVVSEKVDGELATVVLKNREGAEKTFELQKLEGKWKVAISK